MTCIIMKKQTMCWELKPCRRTPVPAIIEHTNSFYKFFMISFYVQGIVLGASYIAVNKTNKNLYPYWANILVGDRDNKYINYKNLYVEGGKCYGEK